MVISHQSLKPEEDVHFEGTSRVESWKRTEEPQWHQQFLKAGGHLEDPRHTHLQLLPGKTWRGKLNLLQFFLTQSDSSTAANVIRQPTTSKVNKGITIPTIFLELVGCWMCFGAIKKKVDRLTPLGICQGTEGFAEAKNWKGSFEVPQTLYCLTRLNMLCNKSM